MRSTRLAAQKFYGVTDRSVSGMLKQKAEHICSSIRKSNVDLAVIQKLTPIMLTPYKSSGQGKTVFVRTLSGRGVCRRFHQGDS